MNRSTLRSLNRNAKRSLPSVSFLSVLCISLNLSISPTANAAIYKCISGTGAVTYSGRKCPDEDTTARIIADSGIGSAGKRQVPAPAAANPTPDPAQKQKGQRDAELEPPSGDSDVPVAD